MPPTADVAIVGGGIVGLVLAREVLIAHAEASVVVLEKERRLGRHASGRNSGVLHAGFYYAPDSLKALLTARGNALLHAFCNEHGVSVRRCGKVVVATEESELPRLRELYWRGRRNGVDVELIGEPELAELEPLARTRGLALWSPRTSVAEPLAVGQPTAGRGAALLRDEAPKYVRRVLVRRAAKLVPSLATADFTIRGRTGVRAQLWSPAHRKLEMDFIVRGDDRSTHLLNIVSPGWTSALAIAEQVAPRITVGSG